MNVKRDNWFYDIPLQKLAYLKLVAEINGVRLSELHHPEWCAKCGGHCCKMCACGLAPYDVEGPITVETIQKMLKTGKYMITVAFDYYGIYDDRGHGFPKTIRAMPYLSMREEGAEIIHLSPFHNRCMMLGPNGCKLSPKDRGTGGLLLKPGPEIGKCINLMGLPSDVWEPYRMVFEEIVLEKKGKSIQELCEDEWCRARDIMREKIRGEVLRMRKISRRDFEIASTLLVYGELTPTDYITMLFSQIVDP